MVHLIFDLDNVMYDTHGTSKPYEDTAQAIRTLTQVSGYSLSILTAGNRELQWKKILELGVCECFDNIFIVPENEDKLSTLRGFRSFRGFERFVIGDRVDAEIAYGNQLGFHTIRIKRGKYAGVEPKSSLEMPVNTISTLAALPDLLAKYTGL